MSGNINEVITNYLQGSVTEGEIQFLKNWLNESMENKKLFDEISDVWSATYSKKTNEFDAQKAFNNIKKQLSKSPKQVDFKARYQQNKSIKLYRNLLRIAAVFIVGLIIGNLILFEQKSNSVNRIESAITEITAPMGSKSKITLPDGTKVWLNAGSTIRYNTAFNQSNRKVTLEGEAYFDVVRKMKTPFLVVTSEVTIKVLGTAFNLKAYPGEGSVETTLVRGSLIVEKKDGEKQFTQTILAPKQRATYIKQTGQMFLSDTENQVLKKDKVKQLDQVKGKVLVSKEIDTEIFTAWKDNKLVFRNETFGSLAIKLERWYGVKISLADSEIKNYHFNGTIENETINDVMDIMKITLPIEYSISHNNITITKHK
jgi:ferric-dicitrate binding protein FerR (iron transport regulator)